MIDLWQEWRMVCLLKKKRFDLRSIEPDIQKAIEDTKKSYTEQNAPKQMEESLVQSLRAILPVFAGHTEPRVNRLTLVTLYAKTARTRVKDKKTLQMDKANSILGSCIQEKWILPDADRPGEIYLTNEGKYFASLPGLYRRAFETSGGFIFALFLVLVLSALGVLLVLGIITFPQALEVIKEVKM